MIRVSVYTLETPDFRPGKVGYLNSFKVLETDNLDFKYGGMSFYPGINDGHIAAQLGQILSFYTHAENAIARIFSSLVGSQSNVVSDVIFDNIRNPAQREQMITKILKYTDDLALNQDTDFITHIKECVSEYKVVTEQRNRYAHGQWWSVWDSFPNGSLVATLLTGKLVGEKELFSGRDVNGRELADFIKRIVALRDRVRILTDTELQQHLERLQVRPS